MDLRITAIVSIHTGLNAMQALRRSVALGGTQKQPFQPSLQQWLAKTGGGWVKHARYYWLLLAGSYLTRRLFALRPGSIARLAVPMG